MKFFVDTADVDAIRDLADTGLVDGVTTNPSLIAKSGRDFVKVVQEICDIVDGPISAEVTATEYDDMLEEGRKLAKIHNNITNLKFVKGDAEKLPFDDNTFDAVINVESSHCYGNMKSFLKEVYRVLKKGGHFSWVDLRGKDMIKNTESAFEELDMKFIHEQTITSEVIEGLDGIHERKIEMIKLHVPKLLQPAFKDFAGVKNSKIYNAFNDGSAVYLAKAFQKS